LKNRQRQSTLLVQLQNDVERLHLAFNALEVNKTFFSIGNIHRISNSLD